MPHRRGPALSALSRPFVICRGFCRRGTVPPGIFPRRLATDDGAMVTMPEVHRVGGLVGAELRGLNLTRAYEDETYEAVLQAWAEHGVIFFRDQHLNAEQRDAFASRLGEIRVRHEFTILKISNSGLKVIGITDALPRPHHYLARHRAHWHHVSPDPTLRRGRR